MAKESDSKILLIDGQQVQITNPGKLYFSSQIKVTKLELVQYYLSIAPGALAGIQDRPIVLKRFVNGAEAEAYVVPFASSLPSFLTAGPKSLVYRILLLRFNKR